MCRNVLDIFEVNFESIPYLFTGIESSKTLSLSRLKRNRSRSVISLLIATAATVGIKTQSGALVRSHS